VTRAQQQIERAYQRAMNIRDSVPWSAIADGKAMKQNEDWYTKRYLQSYKNGTSQAARGFHRSTRVYLKTIRKLATA
jgi:hypothetical protein